ncbi:MAG: NUDIX domain-containing protein [Saprospiraceae bacterium]
MNNDGLKRAAVFCILQCQEQYLLLKRAKQPNVGKYVPVGGKIDPYESPESAVVREIMEETGIHIPRPKFSGVLIETSPTSYNWISFIYKADIDFVPPPYCDEGELFWISAGDLKNLDTPPTDHHIYMFIKAEQPFVFSAVYDENLVLLEMYDRLSGIRLLSK